MKKIITSLLTLLGLAACSQQVYDNTYEVDSFTTTILTPQPLESFLATTHSLSQTNPVLTFSVMVP